MEALRWRREYPGELFSVLFYGLLLLLPETILRRATETGLRSETGTVLRSETLLLLSASSFLFILTVHGHRYYRLISLLLPPGLLAFYGLVGGFEPFTLTLALFLLHLGAGAPPGERPFLQRLFSQLRAVYWAAVFTLLVFLLITLLLWAVEALFGFRLMNFVNDWLWDLNIALVAPLTLLHFRRRSATAPPLPVEGVFRRLGDGVLLIYSFIIFGYISKILLHRELPNGEVVKVLLPYLLGSLYLQGWHRATGPTEALQPFDQLMGFYYRWLNLLNLAPLALLLLAIKIRLEHYGLTPDRIHLVVLAGLLLLANGLLLLPRVGRERFAVYRLLLVLLTATVLVDGYLIPHKRWSEASQRQRLERLLNENGLLRNGQMDWERFKALRQNPERAEALRQIQDARRYLGWRYDNGVEIKPFGIGSDDLDGPKPTPKEDNDLILRLSSTEALPLAGTHQHLLLAGVGYELQNWEISRANPAAKLPSRDDWQRHVEEALRRHGLEGLAKLNSGQEEKLLPVALRLEYQGQTFIAKQMKLNWTEQSGWQVEDYDYEAYIFSAAPE